MASTISLQLTEVASCVETFTGEFVSPGDATLTFTATDTATYGAGTAVPVTLIASGTLTLSAGAGTLDLTALPGINAGETVNGTGLRLQFARFKNKSTNANAMTIAKGASNGFTGFGAAYSETLTPGQWVRRFLDEDGPDISGTVKTLDVAGTGAQVLEYYLVFG